MQLDTEYTGSVKPLLHPLRLISDAFHAQSSSKSATAEDDGLWDTIKKASFDTSEGSDDTAPTEPIPIFANVFSDETIRLLSLIPADASDKDKSAPTFALRSPVSPGRPRSSSLPETPLLVQSERGRPPPSSTAIVAPGLSANNSTAPTTAAPETPSDWLQFSNQGFGTIPGSRDLAAKLWDDDVEKTVPPPVSLSRKSSHRAQSRHSSLDDAKTPVQPVPPTPAPPVSKVTLVAKVKLDEAFIDFWADSLLDPISKRWPRFVLCQLKTFSPADTSATPTPAWLVIEQRFVHLRPVSPVKEEAEVTVPPARPRPLSPQTESSRLSAAFSIVSKKRFGLFTGGNGDPKSPKDKTGRLPQVGEYGEVVGGPEDDTAVAEKQVEGEAKDNVDGATAPAITTADAVVPVAVGISAAAVASAVEVTSKEDDLPTTTAVSAPSELADISAPKADVPVKDEPPHGATSQNGLVNDEYHDEEQCEPGPETAATQDPAGDNDVVIPPVMGEPTKTEVEPAVSGVEAEPTQPETECVPAAPYSAGFDEAIIAQAEVAHPEPEPLIRESSAVVEPSALEPSSIAPFATAVIEESLHETPAPQVVEPDPVVEAKPTAQDPLAGGAARATESAHTPDEVPAPVAQPDLISEIPNAGSEGVARDSPSEPASVASPHPTSEQPTPEDDVPTVGEMQVAATDLAPVIVEDPPAAELEPVPTDDTVPAIQTISTDKSQATDSADAAEMTVPLEEPAPVVGEVIVEGAQPVAIPERDDAVPGEHNAEAATPEPEIIPAPVANDTASPSLENGRSAAAQAAPEERAPSAEPDAEHDVFVTQSAEGLPSQATPQIQDPVIDEQPPAEETTPIPEASASNSIPVEELTTSHEDEAVADGMSLGTLILLCVLTTYPDAPVTRLVPGGASVPSETSPPDVPDVPVTESVPEPNAPTAFAHDPSQSPTNDSTEPVVPHNEQVDAGEPSVVIAAGDASIANPVDEVSELKAEVDIVAEEAQAASKESESAIPTEELPAPVTEISMSVIEEPVAPTEAEIPVEAPAPVVQETDATAEEAILAAAETPAPTLEPATDVPVPEVTASEVAETTVEAPAPAPMEPDVLEEVTPVAANALAVEPASAIGESTPSVEDVLPVHDHSLAAEQSVAVPEEPAHLPEETASEIAEPLVEPAFIPEEPTPAATEAAAEPAPGTEEAAPATTEALAEFTPVTEEPAPLDEAAAPTTMEAPAEPAPVTEEAAHAATEAPADPACVLEAAADAVAVAPVTETPLPEQFAPDLDETPAPPDEPAPVHGEDEPTVPEPPVEDPAPVPVLGDPATTTESATPTADDALAECVEEGAESPSAEPAAAEHATAAEEEASGLEGAVGAEPAAEEASAAISTNDTPAIAEQEPPSVETTAASELETPVGASVSSEATEDAANTGKIVVSFFFRLVTSTQTLRRHVL